MLVGQILDALGHAHRAGIVHRDLKPANLMLTDAGVVKVMDFGIARVAGTERMTSDGLMVGTPAYMAPEQVRGDEVDGRTDLYAAGVVLYRLLTGKLPFKAETAVAMIQSQLNERPTLARDVRGDLPHWLDGVLMRSLAKRPADRYQSADEFRRALDSLGALDPEAPRPDDLTVATPSSPYALHTISARPAAAMTPPAGPNPTTTLVLNRSHLAVAGGFAAILLAVVGLLAWVALRRPTAAPVQVMTMAAPAGVLAPAIVAPLAAPTLEPAVIAEAPPPKVVRVQPAPPPPLAATTPSTPPRIPATLPASEILPPPGLGGRGDAPARPPDADFRPIVVRDLRAVTVINGRSSKVVDAIVAFSEQSITASDSHNGTTVKTFAYSAVTHATVSRSRKPRGAGGAFVETPGGIPEGNIFSRGAHLWVTLETADDRLVLRLDPEQLRPVTDLVGQRTKVQIERYMDPEAQQ
jgi:serine/threonine-protein kinase